MRDPKDSEQGGRQPERVLLRAAAQTAAPRDGCEQGSGAPALAAVGPGPSSPTSPIEGLSDELLTRLVAVLVETPDFVGVADAQHRVVYINPGGRALCGIAPDEDVTRLTIADLTTPVTYAEHLETRLPTAQREGVWRGETVLVARDGRRTPISQVIVAHRNSEGLVTHYSTIARDQSSRVAAEAALRAKHGRMRSMLDRMVTVVGLLSPEGIVLEVNQAAVERSGYQRKDIVGKHVADTAWWNYSAESRQQITDEINKAAAGEVAEFESLCRLRDGQFLHAQGAFAPVFDDRGNVIEIIGSGLDVTAYKRAEESMRRHLTTLAHDSRVAMLGELVGGLAHELNQPLAAIANFADASISELATVEPTIASRLHHRLTRISEEALRAGAIIRGLRSFVRKSETRRARFDLNEAVREIVTIAAADARSRHVEVVQHLDEGIPPLVADRTQVQQIVLNLLTNAFDALAEMPPDERRVEVRSLQPEPDQIEIVVSDQGKGFTSQPIDRIFDAFVTTKAEGLGLGLAISRAIVEAHGGQIGAVPNEPHGARFHVRLPINAAGATLDDRPSAPSQRGALELPRARTT